MRGYLIPVTKTMFAGNVFSCNYATVPGHCYYFDYATSGITVEGGACINVGNGVKLNTGKR